MVRVTVEDGSFWVVRGGGMINDTATRSGRCARGRCRVVGPTQVSNPIACNSCSGGNCSAIDGGGMFCLLAVCSVSEDLADGAYAAHVRSGSASPNPGKRPPLSRSSVAARWQANLLRSRKTSRAS